MHKLAILSFDGVPAFELGCALEVFGLPRPEFADWYETEVISLGSSRHASSANLHIEVKSVKNLDDYDTLIVPAWSTENTHLRVDLAQQLVDFYHSGRRLVSFCSGAFLLAQLGLLDNRPATTHWRYAEQFQARFPRVRYQPNVLYTLQDNLACSAGSAAALDLSIELVRQDFGHRSANQVARQLVLPAHRQGGQAQFVETPVPPEHSRFSATLDWAVAHLQQPLQVEALAQHANMSRRSFDRHFRASLGMSPKAWLNQQRVNLAKQLLEDHTISIEQLARQVGFDNPITLRGNFSKYVGVSPSAYQAQFSRV